MLGIREVARVLLEVAPDLVVKGEVRDVPTVARRSKQAPVSCGVCSTPMLPIFLGGVELDRCLDDNLLWFDREELARVLDAARAQRAVRARAGRVTWLDRLFGIDPL